MQSDLHARGIKPQSPGLRENFQQVGMALPGGTGCESINECFLLHGTRPDSVLDIMNEERPPGTEVGITFWLWLPQVRSGSESRVKSAAAAVLAIAVPVLSSAFRVPAVSSA